MSKLTFSVEIDTTNTEHVQAAIVFMSALGGQAKQVSLPPKSTPKSNPKPAEKPKPPKTPTPPPATKDEAEESNAITAQDLRNAVTLRVKNPKNKTAMRAKFRELGATRVSDLAEEHYATFLAFVEELPVVETAE